MVINGITIVYVGRGILQYLRLTLGPGLVIGGHITLDRNHWIICGGDVGLLLLLLGCILNRLKG